MSAEEKTFVDTNVLLYAYDAEAGPKREVARSLVTELWNTRRGVVSTQVLQELYVNVTRKLGQPLERSAARELVRSYLAWPVHRVEPADVISAAELEDRHRLSFWDALIIVAAQRSVARRLVSEDLQAGRQIAGLSIQNPFA